MSRVIAIANQKGGVGKTTTVINLGASLAAADMKTLLIDLDPQSNAGSGLGIRKGTYPRSTYHVLVHNEPLAAIIQPTELDALYVAPASRELVGTTVELSQEADRDQRLRWAIGPVVADYDFILIDCPPSLDILTVNALIAAHSILIPIQCEYFALEGVSELMETIRQIRRLRNPDLEIEGVLLTMFDERTNLSHQVMEDLKGFFGDQLFSSVIPRNIRLGEAPSHGRPILLYDIKSKGAESYIRLAKEIIYGTQKGSGTRLERPVGNARP
ncbi:MAG: ParA family protein [Acidobacteria bacterium]|nr:ParA family protein [Acidobacteriota bacterium]